MRKLFFFGATLLLSTLSAGAVDFLVQTGEDTDPKWDQSVITATGATLIDLKTQATTIDAALTTAITTNKKEIWFAGGTYTFAASYANKNGTQFVGGFAGTETTKDARALIAGSEAWDYQNKTIFDGNNSVQLFSTGGAANTVLDGLTIQHSKSAANAGVVRLGNGSTVQGCRFLNDTAANQGGAIQIYTASATISDCYFEGNAAKQGGAVFVNNDNAKNVVISNCLFHANQAGGFANAGGAIQAQNAGLVTVKNCYFSENKVTADNNGTAVSFAGTNEANTIQNCLFYANKGKRPAVYMAAGNFYYNTVVENEGGAMFATKGKFTNNVFWATEQAKAAMWVDTVTCVFDHNAAILSLTGDGGKAVVTNHIVLSPENTGSETGVNYPKFVNVEKGEFAMQKGSALIGKGIAIEGITTDLVGKTRTQADLGAFAYIEDSTTAIDNARPTAVDIEAALRAGEVYNLFGQRVGELKAGNVYIVQGMKVLTK